MKWFSAITSWVAGLFTGVSRPGVDQQVEAIQRAAVNACGFLPLAETAIGIIGASNPSVLTAASVARYICSIVQKPPMTTEPAPVGLGLMDRQSLTGGQPPKIQTWIAPDGSVIRGSFVKR